jgi:hypothetical protein
MITQNFKSKQVGASFTAILAFLVLLVFSLNFVVPIVSLHWDDKILVTILDDLPEAINRETSAKEVRKLLNKRLGTNHMSRISTDQLVITKHKGEIKLIWQYERREHVMSNVDIVLTFNHEYSY